METPPGSPLPPCRWHVSVTNCIDSEYFVGLHWVAFSLSLVASILGFWNLWYRRRRGHKIWKDGLTTFDSYIALMTIYVTGRVTHSVIIASGHMPNITFAQIIHDIPHSFALTGMWVYMLSVIEMTPAHATKFWLPNAKQIIWIRRTGYCYQIFVMTPLVTLCGLAWDQGHWDRFVTLTAVVYWAYAFDCGMLGLGFLLFGWQMTRIAATTLRDLKAGGQIGTVAGRRLRAQIEKSITKMKAVNISLGLAMAWFAIILLFFGFLQDQVHNTKHR
ncbi:uncharacterized protein EV422DRAFT_535242 [Fimicolochytrium jonesii]|uniref:uncharacterized protein n=1 Tax=Fimicolochytrium jonesii TaxID=1396493 RepID=UPI0022FE7828|nr:uncharacterized protein EV422DRAFT_535242 [Fimicolochytrium jonesii]KAI8819138.1 hypothetical protein EV422DRAFT_535242 [Fimicolochytrium jonesii]